jgi:hypothetical protein
VTCAAAAALEIGNLVRSGEYLKEALPGLVPGSIGSTLLMSVLLWAVLSPRPPLARVVLAFLFGVLVAIVVTYIPRHSIDGLLDRLLTTLIQATWLSGSLLVVRACGYRLIWPADWVWAAGLADEL